MDLKPAWIPTPDIIAKANITHFMSELDINDIKKFHQWTVDNYQDFWQKIIEKLGIVFKVPPIQICDLSHGIEVPSWLPGAKMNIADSCFTAPPSQMAIIYLNGENHICKMTYAELNQLSNRVANSLIVQGFKAGDAIAIAMPMDIHAIAIYLGIIKMGGIVVSIADSFSSQEISTRLNIAKARAVFTQDFIAWGG